MKHLRSIPRGQHLTGHCGDRHRRVREPYMIHDTYCTEKKRLITAAAPHSVSPAQRRRAGGQLVAVKNPPVLISFIARRFEEIVQPSQFRQARASHPELARGILPPRLFARPLPVLLQLTDDLPQRLEVPDLIVYSGVAVHIAEPSLPFLDISRRAGPHRVASIIGAHSIAKRLHDLLLHDRR